MNEERVRLRGREPAGIVPCPTQVHRNNGRWRWIVGTAALVAVVIVLWRCGVFGRSRVLEAAFVTAAPMFMACVVATALVVSRLLWGRLLRALRLGWWQRTQAVLGPAPTCDAEAFGPARALIREAQELRADLAGRVPLCDDHLQQLGAWMDALGGADPTVHQLLLGAGIDPGSIVRTLQATLETKSANRAGLGVMRVIDGFLSHLASARGGLVYRARA